MAPENRTHAEIDSELRSTVNSLFAIMIQVYEHKGEASNDALQKQVPALVTHITHLLRLSQQLTVEIPPEVIEYVQDGRNPDIYTREFVELAMRNNQRLKGKTDAFARFRDVLAREIAGGVPQLKTDVERVVGFTGGTKGVVGESAG